MRNPLRAVFAASALVVGIAAAPAIYAHDSQKPQGSMMGPGMMGQGEKMGGGNMMSQMNAMMENCNKMMQGMMGEDDSEKPNEQWQKETPLAPEEKG